MGLMNCMVFPYAAGASAATGGGGASDGHGGLEGVRRVLQGWGRDLQVSAAGHLQHHRPGHLHHE